MVLRKFTLFFVFLVAFVLLGSGCKSKAPPQDIAGQSEQEAETTPQADASAEGEVEPELRADSGVSKPDASVIPEGWEVYRNKEGGYEIAYPASWRVTDDGTLYKDAPNLGQLLAESNGHFTSVAQVAPASIGVVAFDPEGKTVDQLWEEARDDSEIDQEIVVSGERGRIAKCGGIRYGECIYMIRGGTAYSISMIDQGLVNSDDPVLQKEIEQIINTFNFLP